MPKTHFTMAAIPYHSSAALKDTYTKILIMHETELGLFRIDGTVSLQTDMANEFLALMLAAGIEFDEYADAESNAS